MSLLALSLVFWPVADWRGSAGNREAPGELAREAAEALRTARVSGADSQAPLTLRWASEAYAAGLFQARREELRPRWLRDHREATAEFGAAVVWAERATRVAEQSFRRARGAAGAIVAQASAGLAPLEGVEDIVWMSAGDRANLQTARRLARSASTLLAEGSHETSAERAREATALSERVREAIRRSTSRFGDQRRLVTWSAWVDETVAWSARTGRAAVVIQKDEHRLTLYEGGRVAHTYAAELGWNNVGDKRIRGDGATPEGRYFVTEMKGRGSSRYHRALLVDYPNAEDDRALADLIRSGAVPRGTRAGGLIEIHGAGGRGRDWTDGCVALTDREVEELFARVSVGTPVTIVGGLTGSGSFSRVASRLSP